MNERLPALPPPQSQPAYSSETSSSRAGSLSSSSVVYNGSASSNNSSYTSAATSANESKTPSPTLQPAAPLAAPISLQSNYSAQQPHTPYAYHQDSYSNMNQPNPDMYYPSQMSTGQSNPPQTVTSNGMAHYQHHPQQPPPLMQPGSGQYTPTQTAPYGSYGYANGLTSPQSAGGHQMSGPMHGGVLSLPPMTSAQQSVMPGQGYPPQPSQGFDTTGQQAPHGMKPRVTATLWEDEGSLCFQVEAKGICVARREDNHMINGTKLLNVAGMTRGRRDGILKSEKNRHVVKIGPMHLKGVWIPFDRALDFANKEKITELLYPLFVHNIGALLYHPTNSNRTNVVMAHAERRKQEQGHLRNPQGSGGLPSLSHHHHSMQASIGAGQLTGPQPIAPNGGVGRPDMHRAHTFPTPPTSASSVMATMGNSDSFQWSGQNIGNVHGNPALSIDTGLSNARSMPTTPATTPPGSSVQNMQYQQTPQSYDTSRQQLYPAPPLQSPFQQPGPSQQGMNRYGQPTYIKHEMGPPGGRPPGSGPDDHHDVKSNGLMLHDQTPQQSVHAQGEEEAEHEHDAEYTHESHAAYDGNRPYTYAPTAGPLAGDRTHMSQDMSGSPGHQNGSGRATPRTATAPQPYYQQNGYNTPPQALPPSSNLYNVMSSERGTANGNSADVYPSQTELGGPLPNGYTPQATNGKRTRDDEEDARPTSRGGEFEGLKRRKTVRENSVPSTYDAAANRNRSAISQRRR